MNATLTVEQPSGTLSKLTGKSADIRYAFYAIMQARPHDYLVAQFPKTASKPPETWEWHRNAGLKVNGCTNDETWPEAWIA